MPIKTAPFDAADYLRSKAAIAAYLEAVLEEDDPAFFQEALGTVARAVGMHQIAELSRTTRAGLYKALASGGNPEFATVHRVVRSLGCRFAVVSVADDSKRRAGRTAGGKRPTAAKGSARRASKKPA